MYFWPQRKRNRLENYNYSYDGYYFVTVCTKWRINYFWEIVDWEMILNDYGEIAWNCWYHIVHHYENIFLDNFVIMPNHIHGILIVGNDYYRSENQNRQQIRDLHVKNTYHTPSRDENIRPLRRWNISNAIKGFKIGVTKEIRQNYGNYEFAWQRSFYDIIIRNDQQLHNTR